MDVDTHLRDASMIDPKTFSGAFAIAGMGMVVGPNDGYVPGQSRLMLEAEAVRRAIEDAGLHREDIDGAIHVHGGPRSGDGALEQADTYTRILGLPVNFYYRGGRGGGEGTFGITLAATFLSLGAANYVVISNSKTNWSRSQSRKRAGHRGQQAEVTPEGRWGYAFGETSAVGAHSFFATRHMARYGTTSEQLGSIAVQARQWANLNPLARMYEKPMSMDDYLNSPVYVWPYHLNDMCVSSDGAIAIVLTTTERARDLAKSPVLVLGVGFGDATGELWWEKTNYERLAVSTAKRTAFGMAGITIEDVNVAQFYDCFTGEVLMQLEDYGFCGKGEGGEYALEGNLGPGGKLPTLTSGGLLSAYHMADMTGISESVLQLREEAGPRQLNEPSISLVTGHGGEAAPSGMCSVHTTLLLGRE